MRFVEVRLSTARDASVAVCYVDTLGFGRRDPAEDDVFACRIGETTLRFTEAAAGMEPFYHFALLVPGDRFDAAHDWLAQRVQLLDDPETASNVFSFDNWNALACYFLDPAGNIVEFIAHQGIGENGVKGHFSADEVVGFSELGLVTDDKMQSASALERQAGLTVFDGDVRAPDRLAFVGERARTLILSPIGRGWLPTGRPAELHPLKAVLGAHRQAAVELPGGQRIQTLVAKGEESSSPEESL